jgi:predicted oxidoreductase (fatty acid repression mutant protein)
VDDDVVDRLAKAFPRYGLPAFADWELQANAMFQFEVWTGLSNLGYGVNIQHYNNLVQEEMVKTFGAPKQWKLIAEMPIGKSMGIYPKLEPYSKDVKVLIRK